MYNYYKNNFSELLVVLASVVKKAGFLLLLALVSSWVAADNSKVPPPKGEQCVEDTEYMRSHHFETVLHQRDKTVIQGIRTTKHSLKNCIDCHITPNAAGQYARYSNSEEHFCATCHNYTAVKIDCFDCHADRPEVAIREALRNSSTSYDPHHGLHTSANELILKHRAQEISQ